MGAILAEYSLSSVGGRDLLHDMQPQNVRGVFDGLRGVQCRKDGGRIARTVIRDGQAERAAHDLGADADSDRRFVVADAVVQQIFQQTAP